MKTRVKERGEPGPAAAWNEIRPGLWMGGHYWVDPAGERQPAVVEIPDGPLTTAQLEQAARLAGLAGEAARAGRSTLVRCHSGYHRSGLVVAQTLLEFGQDTGEAIALRRQRRSPRALNNHLFEEYLHTGLDVAALLSSLG